MIKSLFKGLLVLLLLACALAAGAYHWVHQPMGARMGNAEALDLSIEPGTTPKTIAQMAVDAGPMSLPWPCTPGFACRANRA